MHLGLGEVDVILESHLTYGTGDKGLRGKRII